MPVRLTVCFLFCLHHIGLAQDVCQDVRGVVRDKAGLALTGAHVYLSDTTVSEVVTDEKGGFRLANISPGWYVLNVKHGGYEPVAIPIVVEAGKELVMEIGLSESPFELQEIQVSGQSLPQIGAHRFTVEETERYAATFYDPARLVSSLPGVIGDNDQANNIVIRGNSPNGLLWRLEGADILNPNHLENAGTFSDRATQNGGGVNILSAQLLGNSAFIKGGYGAGYGNLVSGVFDMKLRKGNNERFELTGQLSLLGTELASEGPLGKKGSSYLVNYRYSTIGLLSLMGVDFGNEKTSFQDVSFHLSFPGRKGELSVFGFAGLSDTRLEPQRDPALWELGRDKYETDFSSATSVMGLRSHLTVSNRMLLKSSAAFSYKETGRRAFFLDTALVSRLMQEDASRLQKLAVHNSLSFFINARHTLTAGHHSALLFFDVYFADGAEKRPLQVVVNAAGDQLLVQPYVEWKMALGRRITWIAGLHGMLTENEHRWEPRLAAALDLGRQQRLSLAFDQTSQLQPLHISYVTVLGTDGTGTYPNRSLGLSRYTHYSAAFSGRLSQYGYRIEAYYQQLRGIPVSTNAGTTFSALNSLEQFIHDSLANRGSGRNYGVELSLEKPLPGEYYFLFSSALYRSLYTAADGLERSSRYDGKYALSLTCGREAVRSGNRSFGIHARILYRGGYLETPIDEALSARNGETVYMDELPFTRKLDDYFRVDLRISSKKEKPSYTRIVAIDIQNLTNRKNIAYRYYDTVTGRIETKYQLGLIPVLSLRIEFSAAKK